MEAPDAALQEGLSPLSESLVTVIGSDRPRSGVLVGPGLVLTSRSPTDDPSRLAIHVDGISTRAEPIADVGPPGGSQLSLLRLAAGINSRRPVSRFAQAAPDDEVTVVGALADGSPTVGSTAVSGIISGGGALVLMRLAGAVPPEGSGVFGNEGLIAVVTRASSERVEALALTEVAGELAEWVPQIRDAVWPTSSSSWAPATPAADALFRWFDAIGADGGTAPAALWAAFILLAEETPRQNFASLVIDDLLATTPDASSTWLVVQLGFDELPAHPSREADPARLGLLAPVVAAATSLRDVTEPGEPLHLRHLLAGALEVWPEPFTSIGGDVARVRGAVLASLRRDMPPEAAEAWARAVASRPPTRPQPTGRWIAGIDADAIGRGDLSDDLHVRNDVYTLCDVLAARDAEPPVSVGLFGQWGTGKSYFMELMRQRMEELEKAAKAEVRAGRQPAYCDEIQQITFNAWHYMDANLWASLAVGLFEGMAVDGAPVPSERAAKLRVELQLREQRLSPVEVKLRSALEDPRLGEAAKELGIDATHGEILELATETERFGGSLRTLLRTLREPGRWTRGRVITLACVLTVVAGLVVVGLALTRGTGGWSALLAWVPAALAAVGAVGRAAARASKGLKKVNDVLKAFSLDKDDVTRERIEADHEIIRIRAELAELEKSRALYDYVLDRAGSDDYHRHFGVISVVRKDLETLVKRLEKAAPSRRIVLYIDDLDRCPPARVVEVLQAVHLLLAFPLFVVVVGVDPRWLLRSLERHYRQILSTDRDGPQDGRDDVLTEATPHDYLEKIFQIPFSLSPMTVDGFGRLIATLVAGRPPATGAADEPRTATDPATPDFASEPARTSPPSGRRRAKGEPAGNGAPAPGGTRDTPQIPGGASVSGGTDTGPAAPPGSVPNATEEQQQAGSAAGPARVAEPIDPNPPKLDISADEVVALSGVGPLIPTPRSAKRLVNLYRLIKAGLQPSEVALFNDERRYEALVVVLAALVGFPRQARPLLVALCQAGSTDPSQTFRTFTDGLGDRPTVEGVTERPGDVDDWDDLVGALRRVVDRRPEAGERPLEDHLRWVASVQRYSFDGALDAITVSAPDDEPTTAAPD